MVWVTEPLGAVVVRESAVCKLIVGFRRCNNMNGLDI